ncbi:MAG: excinuclease ABC subunit UvrA, partial [Candidatus Binatia bacterium]
DSGKAVTEGAIPAWNKRFAKKYAWALRGITRHYGASPGTPFGELPEEARSALLYGSEDQGIKAISTSGQISEKSMRRFAGIIPILDRRYRESESDFVRSELERYMAEHRCSQCEGTRLRLEARQVFVGGRGIHELCAMPVSEVTGFISGLKLRATERRVAKLVLREIKERLGFLLDVGLGYLSLDRPASTLSGGESQRIRLATQIGAGLSGVLYVLDEPSIGLHQRDNARLLDSLKRLTKSGNSVLVVEHDEETIRAADHVIDMGPGAGRQGGAIVSCGTAQGLERDERSLTGRFLSGRDSIEIPRRRRAGIGKSIRLRDVTHHNLKGVDVEFPLGCLVCVTGVSGSGKSSLVVDTLYPALANRLHGADREVGKMTAMDGVEAVDKVIDIDQAPIGRTPRSNPATYTGLFSDIRALFAGVPEARMRGYSLGRFSFNVAGGRCEGCSGDGVNRIEMHFLPDVYVTCELCQGRRYNRETLQIRYKGKTVADLLDMTVTEALDLLHAVPPARRKLETLAAVGLEYLHLGQSATTLSGGEAQRIKLAKELARTATG